MAMAHGFRKTMLRWAVALLGLCAAGVGAQPGAGASCGCGDAADLFARYCSANTAIREWNRLISQVRNQERSNGKMTYEDKKDVAECVNETINIQYQLSEKTTWMSKPRKAGGETNRSCEIEVNAPTACLKSVINSHEAWHKRTCEAHYKPDAPWRATGNLFDYIAGMSSWLSDFSLVDYMFEERTGYMIEAAYTRGKLEELSANCPLQSIFPDPTGKRGFTLRACPTNADAGMNAKDWVRNCKRM